MFYPGCRTCRSAVKAQSWQIRRTQVWGPAGKTPLLRMGTGLWKPHPSDRLSIVLNGIPQRSPVTVIAFIKVYKRNIFVRANTPHKWQLPSTDVQPGRQPIARREYCTQISVIEALDSYWSIPLHVWNEFLIFYIFQRFLTGHNVMAEVVITIHGEAILFF